jgi:hypothetical protein
VKENQELMRKGMRKCSAIGVTVKQSWVGNRREALKRLSFLCNHS